MVGIQSQIFLFGTFTVVFIYLYILEVGIRIRGTYQPKITQNKQNEENRIHSDDENIKISCTVSPDCESGCGGTFWE